MTTTNQQFGCIDNGVTVRNEYLFAYKGFVLRLLIGWKFHIIAIATNHKLVQKYCNYFDLRIAWTACKHKTRSSLLNSAVSPYYIGLYCVSFARIYIDSRWTILRESLRESDSRIRVGFLPLLFSIFGKQWISPIIKKIKVYRAKTKVYFIEKHCFLILLIGEIKKCCFLLFSFMYNLAVGIPVNITNKFVFRLI